MLLASILAAAVAVMPGAAFEPLLAVLNSSGEAITASTTRVDLVNRYGAANVRDQDVEIGEGEVEPGTVLFPQEPRRALEIIWKDPQTKLTPQRLMIRGSLSQWKTAHQITLGTSLRELERINRHPFSLYGFAWDYSGTVASWQNGSLQTELEGQGRVILRLNYEGHKNVPLSLVNQVEGDRIFLSNSSAMRRINPQVYEIVWIFP